MLCYEHLVQTYGELTNEFTHIGKQLSINIEDDVSVKKKTEV